MSTESTPTKDEAPQLTRPRYQFVHSDQPLQIKMQYTSLKPFITHHPIEYAKGYPWSAGEMEDECDGISDVEGADKIDGQVNGFLYTDYLTSQHFYSMKQMYKYYEMRRIK